MDAQAEVICDTFFYETGQVKTLDVLLGKFDNYSLLRKTIIQIGQYLTAAVNIPMN